MTPEMKLQIPEKLGFLMSAKARFKIAYGGRGAAKSWSFADCLIARVMDEGCRILCTREQQNSIKDSVHRLLCDRISHHGLDNCFDITESEIRCRHNYGLFLFKGLRQNINEIKSLEGIKYCWVEEGNKVSADSWEVLTPTIREPDSEIWVTFNTGSEGDVVYTRFVSSNHPEALVCKINYYDNPWFPDVLRKEMEYDRVHNPERYRHVWLGEPGTEGRFFSDFGERLEEKPFVIQRSDMDGRIFGSLDSGTTHATSFGLHYIDDSLVIHRLMTYEGKGLTIAGHAQQIYDKIASFPFTDGFFPSVIWADPSMWTKVKLNEYMVRSPIDEYIDLFRLRNTVTIFERANNDKINGCAIMRMFFNEADSVPKFRYFSQFNTSWVRSMTSVITDENNPEIYAKQDGDDGVDDGRYGLVGCNSVVARIRQRQRTEIPKTRLELLLAGKLPHQRAKTSDFYDNAMRVI